jgi:hypothetical protein
MGKRRARVRAKTYEEATLLLCKYYNAEMTWRETDSPQAYIQVGQLWESLVRHFGTMTNTMNAIKRFFKEVHLSKEIMDEVIQEENFANP